MVIKLDDKRIFNHCPDEKYVTRMLTRYSKSTPLHLQQSPHIFFELAV